MTRAAIVLPKLTYFDNVLFGNRSKMDYTALPVLSWHQAAERWAQFAVVEC